MSAEHITGRQFESAHSPKRCRVITMTDLDSNQDNQPAATPKLEHIMTTNHIRVPLVTPGTQAKLQDIEARILKERGRISLLYQVLLNSAPIAQGWEAMLTAVRNQTSVPADLRELMILRVAVLNKASFEFEAHVPHALKAGVAQIKIDDVRQMVLTDSFSEEEKLLLKLTDHMTRDIEVPSALMTEVTDRYTAETVVELVATVAAYNMVSRFLVALNIVH
jgi:4-carboxymuconolactone decarboxylase